ncbi:MAG TPA: hypothetical protein VGQ56_18930 [Gemmatimonadaceae bacterium]|jgi:hypothetical protein|nr:hypothetical protein [Gemmatimonadaceae bacterium]
MHNKIATAVALLVFGAVPMLAQAPSPKTARAADKAPANFVGEWEGAYQTDHGPGGPMSLRITKDTAWKATADVISGSQTIPNIITNVSVDGNTIAWTQELMGMTCKASAVLDGVELKGTTDCGHASMTYAMRKK